MSEVFLNFQNYQDTTLIPKIKIEQTITKISVNTIDSIGQARAREREYHRMLARQKELQNNQVKQKIIKKISYDTTKIPYLNKTIEKEIPEPGEFSTGQFKLYNFDTNEQNITGSVYKIVEEVQTQSVQNTDQKPDLRYTPSWFLGVFILIFFLFAWIRLRFKKQFEKFLAAIFSFQTAANVYRNKSLLSQRVSFQMNLLFVLTGGLFLTQLFHYYTINIHSDELTNVVFAFLMPLTFIVYKFIMAKLVGFFSYKTKLFDEFYFNTSVYLKMLGLIALPLVVLIPYLNAVPQEILFTLSFILFGIVFILWFFRTFQIFIRKGVSIFFLILYLCALEILPVLIAVKFISE